MEEANLDYMAGWIYSYRVAMEEKKQWEARKKEWETKWRPFIELFREQLFAALSAAGTDTGTLHGEPVIVAKETKRNGYEVHPTTVRRIELISKPKE